MKWKGFKAVIFVAIIFVVIVTLFHGVLISTDCFHGMPSQGVQLRNLYFTSYFHPRDTRDELPALVNLTEERLYWYRFRQNNYREQGGSKAYTTDTKERSSNVSYTVLLFNFPDWISLESIRENTKACFYQNCIYTKDRDKIQESSAVIFCITCGGMGSEPPLTPQERPNNQVWIFFSQESPAYISFIYSKRHSLWKNTMNWSMDYRLESDIPVPYGYLEIKQSVSDINFLDIFRKKTKFAAWIVSNCQSLSVREKFVERLKENDIPVDVYGRCGKALQEDPKELINDNYKFYLSFENSMCSDYVTEKFFGYFQLDTILIVRGGAKYDKLLPKGTYINTADFDTVREVASYLKLVNSSESLYIEYLRKKENYRTQIEMGVSYCTLCGKLNNFEENKRIYENVPSNLETCYEPSDIQ